LFSGKEVIAMNFRLFILISLFIATGQNCLAMNKRSYDQLRLNQEQSQDFEEEENPSKLEKLDPESQELLDLPNTPAMLIPLTPATPQVVINDELYQCLICESSFPDRSSRNNHYQTQHRNPDGFYHCPDPDCKFKTPSPSTLVTRHYKPAHLNEKNFSCSECTKAFTSKHRLATHACLPSLRIAQLQAASSLAHSQTVINQKSYECSICQSSFPDRSSRNNHYQTQHRNPDGFYHCPDPDCKFKVSTPAALIRHYNPIHLKKREFPCPQCSQFFTAKSRLDSHLTNCSALSAKKFQCTYCKKRYHTFSLYESHVSKCSEYLSAIGLPDILTSPIPSNQQETTNSTSFTPGTLFEKESDT